MVCFAPPTRCHPHVALQNLGVRFARGNHALGEALALSDEINWVIKILILFLEMSALHGSAPNFAPPCAEVLHTSYSIDPKEFFRYRGDKTIPSYF